MLDLVRNLQWVYLSVIYQLDGYGYNAVKYIRKLASEYDLCIQDYHPVNYDFEDIHYDSLLNNIGRSRKPHVVIVFAQLAVMQNLFLSIKRHGMAGQLIWILGDVGSLQAFHGILDTGVGSFITRFRVDKDEQIKAELGKTVPSDFPGNPWLLDFWQFHTHCEDEKSDRPNKTASKLCNNIPLNDVPGYNFASKNILGVQSVEILARALETLISERCPRAFFEKELLKTCTSPGLLVEYLTKTNIPSSTGDLSFDETGAMIRDYELYQIQSRNGRYSLESVAVWSQLGKAITVTIDKLQWHSNTSLEKDPFQSDPALDSVPESICSSTCRPGEFFIKGELSCCWECRPCRDTEVVANNSSTCRICDNLTWPDQTNFTKCLPIAPSYLRWTETYGVGLISLTGSGLVITLAIILLVIKHRQRRAIKGSSLEMLTIILIGVLMAFVTVILFIARPSFITCHANRLGFSLSCTLIFGPLLVKTNRVYQVFAASAKLTRVSVLAKGNVTGALLAVLVIVQVS